MHTNNLIINHRRTGKAVEGITKGLPQLDGKSTTAFVVKAVYPIDAGAFMVATQNEEIFGILDLVGE